MAHLQDFPRPNVAVDLALLTVLPETLGAPSRLVVLMQDHPTFSNGIALPGRFLRDRQSVVGGMHDVLRTKVRVDVVPTRPLLLGVFDDPSRDPRAWTISLAHALALPADELTGAAGTFVPVGLDGRLVTRRRVLFDHAEMIRQAAQALRDRYERRPDPDGLVGAAYTLTDLRRGHEAVLGESLRRDTFERRMKPHLEETGDQRSDRGRPAKLYRARPDSPLNESEQRRLKLPRSD